MTNQTAAQAYETRVNNVQNLIAQLQAELEGHKAAQAKTPTHWTHAGELGYIEEQLQEMVNFMSGKDQ